MKTKIFIDSFFKTFSIILLVGVCVLEDLKPIRAVERVNHLNYFGIGARAIGLNNAYTSACNDYTAPFWNPAAMGFFSTTKIGGMHTQMCLDREMNYFSFVTSTEKFGAFAIGWAGFSIQDIEARTANTEEPESYFSSTQNIFFLTYAYRMFPVLSIGGNVKMLDFNIDDIRANGFGVDLSLFCIPLDRLRLGLVIQDIGSNIIWSTGNAETFSNTYRLGCSFVASRKLLISCDYHQTENRKAKLAIATEFSTFNFLKVRCGFEQQGWALGLGFTLPISNTYLNVNYAIATDRLDTGVANVFDLSVVY